MTRLHLLSIPPCAPVYRVPCPCCGEDRITVPSPDYPTVQEVDGRPMAVALCDLCQQLAALPGPFVVDHPLTYSAEVPRTAGTKIVRLCDGQDCGELAVEMRRVRVPSLQPDEMEVALCPRHRALLDGERCVSFSISMKMNEEG